MHTRFSIVRAKIASILPSALFIITNLFIFGPITVFKGNSVEFKFGFFDLATLYIWPLFAALFIILLIGILLPLSKTTLYSSLLFSFGLLFWIQGNFIVWNYGVFDGSLIEWNKYSWYGLIDIAIWCIIIIATLLFYKKIAKSVSFISFSYIIAQIALLTLSNFNDFIKTNTSSNNYDITSQFNYSSSFNIVHIIFDSHQTDVFKEIIEEDGLADKFQGFTLFEENMGVASSTIFAVPAMFTGKTYEGDTGRQKYTHQASEEGFPNLLYEKGYQVNLAPMLQTFGMKHTNYYDIKRIAGITKEEDRMQSALYLLDIAMFRHFPHFLKRYIYNNNNWFFSKLTSESSNNKKSFIDKAFFRKYIAELGINGPRPAYHFIHLQPPHPPYVTNQDGSYAGKVLPPTRENYKNEARYVLRLFTELLEKMKTLEIYDSALIVLQGDHGSRFQLKRKNNDAVGHDTLNLKRISALLVVKPPMSKGPLQTSQAPTMVTDIAPTIMEYAGYSFPGSSVFRIDPSLPRTRTYRWFPENSRIAHRYTIEGSIYNSESLKKEEQVELLMESVHSL